MSDTSFHKLNLHFLLNFFIRLGPIRYNFHQSFVELSIKFRFFTVICRIGEMGK